MENFIFCAVLATITAEFDFLTKSLLDPNWDEQGLVFHVSVKICQLALGGEDKQNIYLVLCFLIDYSAKSCVFSKVIPYRLKKTQNGTIDYSGCF